jgi:hypothetical protein
MPRLVIPFALTAILAPLTAQGGAATFVPKPHLVRAVAEHVPQILAGLPQSAIGKLLKAPEVADAWDVGLRRQRERADRAAALLTAVHSRELELEPWIVSNLGTLESMNAVRQIELGELQRFEIAAVLGEEGEPLPTSVVLMQCSPRAEGRWTRVFEERAQRLAQSKFWQSEPDAKFAGYPTHVFQVKGRGEDEDPDLVDSRMWLLHLPGLFAFGGGTPDRCGALGDAVAATEGSILGEMNLEAYVAMFSAMGQVPPEFEALGFSDLQALRWRWRFQGALVLDEFEVELSGEPRGMVGALLAGKAELPAQPLPDGALAQVRAGFDLKLLLQSLRNASDDVAMLLQKFEEPVTAAFTGGIAFGVTAPARGGVIPRLYLSLGIADDKALDQLLGMLLAPTAEGSDEGSAPIATKKATFEGTECTLLKVTGMPAAIQPAFCRLDGVLHIAESGPSLRAFLAARKKGGEAMDIGDAPLPAGAGEVLPTFDMRGDEQALYRTFHAAWLPLLKLIPDGGELAPLLTAAEMPEPDAVVPLLGKSRGVLRKDGNVFRLQQLGPLGGVETAAMAMTWGPFLSGIFHRDWIEDQLHDAIATAQLQAIWPVLEAFEAANQRRPANLGELFVSSKLAADALLLPGDTMAEPVALPAGDTRLIKSSFRYFATPVGISSGGDDLEALLVAIRPQRYGRPVLTTTGTVPQIWGEDSNKAIDQFGK